MSARAHNLIQTDVYFKSFKSNTVVTAKQAKEIFFLSTDDLKYLPFTRPKGWGAYVMKTGQCKHYDIHQVREAAIEKYGSVQALVAKAELLNKRRTTKAEREYQKQLDEERKRQEAKAAAEKARLDAIAEKKRKALERKLAAEQQARDAESWRQLLRDLGGRGPNGVVDVPSILRDAALWRQQNAGAPPPPTIQNPTESDMVPSKSISP